jgi:hypothetical protein
MFSVIFEVLPNKEHWGDYLDNAKMLRPELEQVEGGARQDSNLQPDVMSGRISIRFVDFAAVSFGFDRVCCGSFGLFLVRNWCGRWLPSGAARRKI